MKAKYRVKDPREFQFVYENGNLIRLELINAKFLKNSLNYSRVGISASTKCGNAVTRNRIRRQIRAILAKHMNFSQSIDMVIVARKDIVNRNFSEIESNIVELLKKVGNI